MEIGEIMAEFNNTLVASVLIAVALLGGSYILTQGDYATKVDISDLSTYPNIYVSSTPPDHSIDVSATASQSVSPDLLVIQLHVETESSNAKGSQARNAVVMAELKEQLRTLGVQDDEIKTAYYNVQPEYDSVCADYRDEYGYCYDWDSVLSGYKTTHALTLKLGDISKGGDVVDGVTDVGVNETLVDSISFTLKDETRRTLELSLLEEAAQKATVKAQNIAKGLGVSLGDALSASESVYYPYTYRDYGYALAEGAAYDAAPSTDFSSGDIEVSATVTSSYEIESLGLATN